MRISTFFLCFLSKIFPWAPRRAVHLAEELAGGDCMAGEREFFKQNKNTKKMMKNSVGCFSLSFPLSSPSLPAPERLRSSQVLFFPPYRLRNTQKRVEATLVRSLFLLCFSSQGALSERGEDRKKWERVLFSGLFISGRKKKGSSQTKKRKKHL